MPPEPISLAEKASPPSSGRSSPAPRAAKRAVEEEIYKGDKALRRYGANIERALGSWEVSPQEWADYIAFLGRLLKAIQTLPTGAPLLPHSEDIAHKLAQCLNPALPSGVHQKALEVYEYIFSAFGQSYVADHLHEFLPGLSAVLSFGSLSVRPALYSIYEQYVLHISTHDLRPLLKSLILSLLPGLEDDTSEDFEQAFRLLDDIRCLFAGSKSAKEGTPDDEGYFWQCLFLAVISNASRRQGALNFLSRKLPSFRPTDSTANDSSLRLNDDAGRIVTPEPGLLIRCFVCGLSDPQILIQRGFLDLLVSNMPLNSPLFKDVVGSGDLDLLVSAAIQVLLRREMSLNRRLWSWFLGPQPKTDITDESQSAEQVGREQTADALEVSQYDYFTSSGKTSLERCILAMFRRNTLVVSDRARPFRICLSLMDRWEIGGSIVPNIFRPAMENAFRYTEVASAQNVAEFMRSASLFFDGVEAGLIWADLTGLLQASITETLGDDNLQMFKWIVQTFNVKDEEMLLIHIPYAATYLLALLQDVPSGSTNEGTALDIVTTLLDLVPDRAFASIRKKGAINPTKLDSVGNAEVIRQRLEEFYRTPEHAEELPFNGLAISDILFRFSTKLLRRSVRAKAEDSFIRVVSVLLTLNSKSPTSTATSKEEIPSVVFEMTASTSKDGQLVAFPTLNSIVSLASAPGVNPMRQAFLSRTDITELEPLIIVQLWEYLSPSQPKYHVEAVKSIWQLHDLLAPDDNLQSSLAVLVRQPVEEHTASSAAIFEALKRFAVLWGHTVAAPISSSPGLHRRSSGMVTVAEVKHSKRRQKALIEPVMLILDLLHNADEEIVAIVHAWLHHLPTLPNIFAIHFDMLTEYMKLEGSDQIPGSQAASRYRADIMRRLEYVLGHIRDVLRGGDEWTWQCVDNAQISITHSGSTTNLSMLAESCCRILSDETYAKSRLESRAMEVLSLLLSSPSAATLKSLDVDSRLTNRLVEWLSKNRYEQQVSLLKILTLGLRLRASDDLTLDTRPGSATTSRKPSGTVLSPVPETTTTVASTTAPPEQLLQCLRLGFSSESARPHLNQWLVFLSSVLHFFPDTILGGLIPLVETLCAELNKGHSELQNLAKTSCGSISEAPESTIAGLLDILEELLSWAHNSAVEDGGAVSTARLPTQPRSLLGNVTTGIFKGDGPSSKSAQANIRLNIVLAFQDAFRVSFKLWTWASQHPNEQDLDKTSAATASYSALRIRNRTRHLLEQTFAAEPLESLEVIIAIWRNTTDSNQTAAALNLLHVMHGTKPRVVVTTTLDAMFSRTNTSGLPVARQSFQTTNLTALDITLFWSAYLESIEDDAMDEIWTDCMTFFKDVLSNPQPYRQALPALISIVLLMAEKVDNTNFGEQRKMRRDLGDTFLRLLAATFTSMPAGILEANGTESTPSHKSMSLVVVLNHAIENIEPLLETADRATSMVNSVSSSLIAPVFHSRFFPKNVTPDFLALLFQIATKAPTARSWKKELNDAFNYPQLLLSSAQQMSENWFPVFRQWCLHDKERVPDLLSRLMPPSSAGIMFGVGASAARLEADRRTQLNLRRLCLLLLASAEDAFVAHLRGIEEKLVELFEASPSSSPSSAVKSDLFMVCRALVLSVSAAHLGPLWPLFNNTMQAALMPLLSSAAKSGSTSNLSLLQTCKLLDLLVATAPDDFQLHEWLYVSDTIDAVYQPSDWSPAALSDQIAESLNAEEHENSPNPLTPTAISSATAGRRRLLLTNAGLPTKDDMKAMTRDDFARMVLLPFFSQLSIHAYEGFYSMEVPDLNISRQNLLEDVLDISTIVE